MDHSNDNRIVLTAHSVVVDPGLTGPERGLQAKHMSRTYTMRRTPQWMSQAEREQYTRLLMSHMGNILALEGRAIEERMRSRAMQLTFTNNERTYLQIVEEHLDLTLEPHQIVALIQALRTNRSES